MMIYTYYIFIFFYIFLVFHHKLLIIIIFHNFFISILSLFFIILFFVIFNGFFLREFNGSFRSLLRLTLGWILAKIGIFLVRSSVVLMGGKSGFGGGFCGFTGWVFIQMGMWNKEFSSFCFLWMLIFKSGTQTFFSWTIFS